MTASVAGHQWIALDVNLGGAVQTYEFVNLFGCEIGDEAFSPKMPRWFRVLRNHPRVVSVSSLMK
jgi:hypothetical protein